MAATAAENGVFVVTQYIPAANSSALQRGPPKNEAPLFLRRFVKGEPKSLGVVQIMIGFICIMLGFILCSHRFLAFSAKIGMPFMCALLFLISGGLSISAEKRGTPSLVKSSLVINVFSAILAAIGVILFSYDLGSDYLYRFYNGYKCGFSKPNKNCMLYKDSFIGYQSGILAVLLLLLLLEFCVAFATCCFGCKSVHASMNQEVAEPLFIAQNNYTQDPRVLPTQATGVPRANGVTLMEDIPMSFGVYPIPGLPQAQEGVQEIPTAPPPSYYKDIPGDFEQP